MKIQFQNVCCYFWTRLVKDTPVTALHSFQTAKLSRDFGTFIGFTPVELKQLWIGSLLHDVGKLLVPSEILYKQKPLTEEEYQLIRQHPKHGIQLLESHAPYSAPVFLPHVSFLDPFIRSHHECLDGTGYPDGLVEDQIPLAVKVLTLCDAYDSMTNSRGYRKPLLKNAAFEELRNNRNQFDLELVEKFVRFIEKYGENQ